MRYWLFLLLFVLPLSWSCRKSLPQTPSDQPGTLFIRMELDDRVDLLSKATPSTIQASDLTLEIFKEDVSIEKFSPIGSGSKEISLAPGSYTVQAYSATFTAPAFEMPVYADEAEVTVQSESTASVELICTQSNAGVRIVYDEAFQEAHSDYSVSISQQGHSLEYTGLDATRTGYFLPGQATLLLTVDGEQYQQTLDLQAQRLYTLTIQDEAAPSGSLGLTLQIDNSYIEEDVAIFFPLDPSSPTPPEEGTRSILYHENFGTQASSSGSYIPAYNDWENTTVSYSGSQLVLKPDTPSSNYPNASGGCCLSFPMVRNFTVSDINTTGATSLALSFGLSADDNTSFTSADIEVTVSKDDSGIATPLSLTLTPYGNWTLVSASSGIPSTASLTLNIKAQQANLLIDDLSISGFKE